MKRFRNTKMAVIVIAVALSTGLGGAAFASTGIRAGNAYVGSAPAITTAQLNSSGRIVYDSLNSPVPPDTWGLSFGGTNTAEFGNEITPASPASTLSSVVVSLDSQACENSTGTNANGDPLGCFTNPGATFPLSITMYLYNAASPVGAPIASDTQSFNVPYRPSAASIADPGACSSGNNWSGSPNDGTQWYDSSDGNCYYGITYDAVFNNWSGVVLPSSVVYGITYNATSGPGSSLNVELSDESTDVTVGSDTNPGNVFVAVGPGSNDAGGPTGEVTCSTSVGATLAQVSTASGSSGNCGASAPEANGAVTDIPAVEFITASPLYDSLNSPAPPDTWGLSFGGTNTAEFGNEITPVSTASPLSSVVVALDSQACENSTGTNANGDPLGCVTNPGAIFPLSITMYLYNAASPVGAPIASDTQSFNTPYRPSADASKCATGNNWSGYPNDGTQWYDSSAANCYYGITYDAVFNNWGGLVLPSNVVYGIKYNATSGPGSSLNVELSDESTDVTAGSDTHPGNVFVAVGPGSNDAGGPTGEVTCSTSVGATFAQVSTASGNSGNCGASAPEGNGTVANIPAVEFNTLAPFDLAGAGNVVTTPVMDAIAAIATPGHQGTTNLFDAFGPTGSATVNTTDPNTPSGVNCAAQTRPTSESAALEALAGTLSGTTAGCLQFVTSSRGPASGDPSGLTWIPFAQDIVDFAVTNTSAIPRTLSLAELQAYYTCQSGVVGTQGAAGNPGYNGYARNPVLPQSGSDTRSFWESLMGITDSAIGGAAFGSGALGCIINGVNPTNPSQLWPENNGALIDDYELEPFSAAQYEIQADDLVTDLRGRAILGDIENPDGSVWEPQVVNGPGSLTGVAIAGGFERELYNVVPTADTTGYGPLNEEIQQVFVGPNSDMCSLTAFGGEIRATILQYHLLPDPSCGSTNVLRSIAYYTVTPASGTWTRSTTPFTSDTPDLQSVSGSGAVTLTITSTSAYADNGFYMVLGTLGSLNGYAVQGTGSPFGDNLYFGYGTAASGDFFNWKGDGTFATAGNTEYGFGPTSLGGNVVVNGSSSFFMNNAGTCTSGGTYDYTLTQLKAGACGLTPSTPVALWVGDTLGSGGSASTTITSVSAY